mgnify:CR=1 FL=1
MQQYAEESVEEHVAGYLQPIFDKEKRHQTTRPFSNQLSTKEVEKIMRRSMEQSERYIKMKKGGATEEDIQKAFNTPQEMTVFSYHGEVDTIMTPMDSIRYYKSFLRAGFMCMDTRTGYVKPNVGDQITAISNTTWPEWAAVRSGLLSSPSSIRWPWRTACRPATLRRTYNRRISWPASLGHPATAAAPDTEKWLR